MLRGRRHDNRVDINFAADDVAHATLGAFIVGDFQAGHNFSFKVQSFKVRIL